MGTAGGEPPVLPAVLFVRRPGAPFANAMHQRFRVLDSLASGVPLPAFLAATAAMPRAACWNCLAPRSSWEAASSLRGKRVGIMGLGNIGSLIAKRLGAFGCIIYYTEQGCTPHCQQGCSGCPRKSRSDLCDHMIGNLEAFFSGNLLLTPVLP
ncbi:hypothetical protein BAE44_0013897 [Dichanthelium oligosanthes]|uniref:D-isomer specific 2-hydroxyacid dehydrogenase NAD-binding domain-containing protein n=1 Tax=Dichanthelium oligosanthes TaxID=888268 RepID=A0A1E5VJ04_9POAL|nr:hypothetical protein BAE44_0013897 [Dichanthelium oligosanthes]